MSRSDNYVMFLKSDRSKDAFYTIPGGVNHVFAFRIFTTKYTGVTMSMIETDPPGQAFSIQAWFSQRPLDEMLFTWNAAVNPVKLTLAPKTIHLWDYRVPNLPPGALALDPKTTYYINVRNMQAAQNAYRLYIPR